ncbi:MAG TPA: hypothetical protein DCM27_01310 [Rhodospirillaceae bacterium]|nr:hypothetical protein [Rhodospirillaceae bacterium]
MQAQTATFWIAASLSLLAITSGVAVAAINIPFTINLSETVTVTGTPRISVDVGGNQRFANYTSGTGTNALTFTLSPTIGDVDLDGITVSSPIDLNGGTIKDTSGNDATLTFTPPNTAGIKVNYPSLGMDFTNGTAGRYTLNGTAYNDLSSFLTASGGTFARNSIATYYDSTGILKTASANTPRFDYDPVTHAAKGILIEENRTNIIRSSEAFSGTGWVVDGAILNVGGTTPSGGSNATSISKGSGNNRIYCFDNSGVTGSKIFSIFVKSNAGNTFSVSAVGGLSPSGITSINTSTGMITSSNPATTSTAIGNGWFRLTIQVSVLTASGNSTYWQISGPLDSIFIWGAQFEQGTFATSYIPTTTAAVTRAADILLVPMQPAIGITSGTSFIHGNLGRGGYQIAGNSVYLDLLGTDNTGMAGFARNSTGNILVAPPLSGKSKFAAAYGGGKSYTIADGGPINSANGIPDLSSNSILHLGTKFDAGAAFINNTIRRFNYYPLLLENTQLQLLTQ